MNVKKIKRSIYIFLYRFLLSLWQPSKTLPHSFLKVALLPLLYCAELCYVSIFHLLRLRHKIFGSTRIFSLPVIGVGNLIVGGTGKSVVVAYIATVLGGERCGIVLRGYGGTQSEKKVPFFVTKKSDVCVVGDEALMYAQTGITPVVVGGDKKESLIALFSQTKATVGIVDDAYQSLGFAIDCMIVLLDGRAPFGNGHCLPAGPLREKDLSRADIIIVTHSECSTPAQRKQVSTIVRQQRGELFCSSRLVWAQHQNAGFFDESGKKMSRSVVQTKRFVAVAGIGSPQQFFAMLAKNGLLVEERVIYPDHHQYTQADVDELLAVCKERTIVTTEKDWAKLSKIVTTVPYQQAQWLRAAVSLAWDTIDDKMKFEELLKKHLGK